MWSYEKVLKFIEDYHATSCLWDATSTDYRNRAKRKSVIESLAAKHGVTGADIEKKIHNLKTSFNREWKKNNLPSGSSTKKSSWFAYDHLLFLRADNESKGSRNIDFAENITENESKIDEVCEDLGI